MDAPQDLAAPPSSQPDRPLGRAEAPAPPQRDRKGRPLRLLTVSSLYPNPAAPTHGVFVETRLRHLIAAGDVAATVVAPMPWFPGRTPSLAGIPAEEMRHGLRVLHPRFVAPPGIGMYLNPFTLERAASGAIRRLLAEGTRFDAIDAHYLYPDGVAAIRLGAAAVRQRRRICPADTGWSPRVAECSARCGWPCL